MNPVPMFFFYFSVLWGKKHPHATDINNNKQCEELFLDTARHCWWIIVCFSFSSLPPTDFSLRYFPRKTSPLMFPTWCVSVRSAHPIDVIDVLYCSTFFIIAISRMDLYRFRVLGRRWKSVLFTRAFHNRWNFVCRFDYRRSRRHKQKKKTETFMLIRKRVFRRHDYSICGKTPYEYFLEKRGKREDVSALRLIWGSLNSHQFAKSKLNLIARFVCAETNWGESEKEEKEQKEIIDLNEWIAWWMLPISRPLASF